MTHIFRPEAGEIRKWRKQAQQAAEHLKRASLDKEVLKLGFVYDDGVITVEIAADRIRALDAQKLGEELYNLVLAAAQTSQPGGSA